jgi:hypothetical protein
MLIGAIIGLLLDAIWIFLTSFWTREKVRQHNADRLKVAVYGPAKFNPHWEAIIASAVILTSLGAVIGYFVGG